MDVPEVVNVKVQFIRASGYRNLQEWMADPNNLYIGRRGIVFIDGKRWPPYDSPWANPFKIGRDGTREDVINKYKTYIDQKIADGSVNLLSLATKRLGCWCKPDQCHGDYLVDLYLSQSQYPSK